MGNEHEVVALLAFVSHLMSIIEKNRAGLQGSFRPVIPNNSFLK